MKNVYYLFLFCLLSGCYTSRKVSKNKVEMLLKDFYLNANNLNINKCRSVLYLPCANEKEAKDDNILRSILNGLTQDKNFKKLEITKIEWDADTALLTTNVYFNNNKPVVNYRPNERTEVNDSRVLIMDRRILWARNAQSHFFIFPECNRSNRMKIAHLK